MFFWRSSAYCRRPQLSVAPLSERPYIMTCVCSIQTSVFTECKYFLIFAETRKFYRSSCRVTRGRTRRPKTTPSSTQRVGERVSVSVICRVQSTPLSREKTSSSVTSHSYRTRFYKFFFFFLCSAKGVWWCFFL